MQRISQHGARRHFRSIWVSDVHLGYHASRAGCLLEFLQSTECDFLYLVGDIVDLWSIRRRPYWPQQHSDVLRTILGKAKYGTRVVYVPGNHDEAMRAYIGHQFGNIAIRERAVHHGANGERLLVLHGDEFDAAVATSRWLGVVGSSVYTALLGANVVLNAVRRRCGFPYWSLAGFLKHKLANAVRYIERYEAAAAAEAERCGLDGVVCGHIHRPAILRIGAVAYHNCGDWVENRTALVEHRDGRIELVDWAAFEDSAALEPAAA